MSLKSEDEWQHDDDHLWEDEQDDEDRYSDILANPPSVTSSAAMSRARNSEPGTPRRRSAAAKAGYVVPSPGRRRPLNGRQLSHRPRTNDKQRRPTERPSTDIEHILTAQEAKNVLALFLRSAVHYASGIFSIVFRGLKIPISLFMIFYISCLILGQFSSAVQNAMQPLCWIPGVSRAAFCSPIANGGTAEDSKKTPPKKADYPGLVNMQSKTFEELLDESADGFRLARDIRKAELATSDLITLVRASQLKSRDGLADALDNFVTDARATSDNLQKFNARLGGAVDMIMASSQRAVRTIEEAAASRRSTLGAVMDAISPFRQNSEQKRQEVIAQEFRQSFATVSSQVDNLLSYADVSAINLDKLEERLKIVHNIVVEEDSTVSAAQQELLALLWTRLGGNQHKVKNFEAHLGLLKDIGLYRRRALAHVAGALETLRTMARQIEDLRLRVNAPQLLGNEIPLDVHMQSIALGIERLQQSRLRAQIREAEMVNKILAIDSE